MRIYPAIDLKEGQVVRLFQGQFDQITSYSSDPVDQAKIFADKGTSHLHVVDLDGARTGIPENLKTIEKIISLGLKVQVGGGIRSLKTASALINAGANRIVLGSLAVENPLESKKIIDQVGPKKITLALDLHTTHGDDDFAIATHGWASSSTVFLSKVMDTYLPIGVSRVLCTDIAKDGTLTGPNFDLYRNLQKQYPQMELIASGGIRSANDIEELRKNRIFGAIIGKALYERHIKLEDLFSCSQKESSLA